MQIYDLTEGGPGLVVTGYSGAIMCQSITHMNARTQSFPPNSCIATRLSLLNLLVSGFNNVANNY